MDWLRSDWVRGDWIRGVLPNVARICAVALVATFAFANQSWAVPVNDLIDNAIALAPGNGSIVGTTATATTDSGAPFAGTLVTSPGVWYTAFGSGAEISLDTFSAVTNYDTKISVYSGYTGTLAGLTPIGGNDDASGGCLFCSAFAFSSIVDTQYWILVHGFGGQSGDFGLNYTNVAGEAVQVSTVPLPAAFPLFAVALCLLGLAGWRMKRVPAA